MVRRRVIRAACGALVAALVTVALAAQTTGTSRLAGRATMTDGTVLSGVTVTLSDGVTTTTAVTAADGRFALDVFAGEAAPLTLSASLPGFQTVTRTGIRARPGQTVNLGDVRLSLGCLTLVDFVATGLREEASRALTVAHLRIESVQPLREWIIDKTCYTGSEVSATVVDDLRVWRAGTRVRFVPIRNASRPPYEPGDEIVVPLFRDAAARQYISWGYGYVVKNGVVSLTAPVDEFEEEIPVATLFERLRDGAGRREPPRP